MNINKNIDVSPYEIAFAMVDDAAETAEFLVEFVDNFDHMLDADLAEIVDRLKPTLTDKQRKNLCAFIAMLAKIVAK